MDYLHRIDDTVSLSVIHHQDAEILLKQLSDAVDAAYDFPPQRVTTAITIGQRAIKEVMSQSAGEWRTTQELDPIDRTLFFAEARLHMQHPTYGPVNALLRQPGIWQLTQNGKQHLVTDRHITELTLPALQHAEGAISPAEELLDSDPRSLSTQQLISALDSHFAATALNATQRRQFTLTDTSHVFDGVPHHQSKVDLALTFQDARRFRGDMTPTQTTYRSFGAAALFAINDAHVRQLTSYTYKNPVKGKPSQYAKYSLASNQLPTTELSRLFQADIRNGALFEDLKSGMARLARAVEQSNQRVLEDIAFLKD